MQQIKQRKSLMKQLELNLNNDTCKCKTCKCDKSEDQSPRAPIHEEISIHTTEIPKQLVK